jgi:hypothetical protein
LGSNHHHRAFKMTSPNPPPAAGAPDPDRVRRTVVRAFEDAGAVSPAAARPLREVAHAGEWEALVALAARGVVREGAPGRFYLHVGTTAARRRLLVTVAVLAVVFLLPVLLLQLTR